MGIVLKGLVLGWLGHDGDALCRNDYITANASVYWDDHRLVGRGLYGERREPRREGIRMLLHDAGGLHQLACLRHQVRSTVRTCRRGYEIGRGLWRG
jgi:hypothetical protein